MSFFRFYKRYSLCFYTIVTIWTIFMIQAWMVYYFISNAPKKTKFDFPNYCVNKSIARSMKSKVGDKCDHVGEKNAFVFYITTSMVNYECYIYILLHQLQVTYTRYCDVDYVILYEDGYQFQPGKLQQFVNIHLRKVKPKEMVSASHDKYYEKCYIKLEAFGLYKSYERIIFLDADGIFLRNPYELFLLNLHPYKVGASICNWFLPKKWLSSSIFVAELSEELYQKIKTIYKTDLKKLYPLKKTVLDMEIFNFIFKEGNDTKILQDLMTLDSHFIDEDYINRFYDLSPRPYYVHFSHFKPHLNRRLSSCLDEQRMKAKPEFFEVYREFWKYYYMYCS